MHGKDYIIYTHSDFEIDTVGKLFQTPNSIVKSWNLRDFITYKGDTDNTNFGRIIKMYSSIELEEWLNSPTPDNNSPDAVLRAYYDKFVLKPFTKLLIPKDIVNREILAIEGLDQMVTQSSYVTFLADYLDILMTDPNYKPVRRLSLGKGRGTLVENQPDIHVYANLNSVYVGRKSTTRSVEELTFPELLGLNPLGENDTNTDQFLYETLGETAVYDTDYLKDISRLISSITTNVTNTGGNFNITLALSGIAYSFDNEKATFFIQHRYKNPPTLFNKLSTDKVLSDDSLANLFNINNLFFIKFEQLKLEQSTISASDPNYNSHVVVVNKTKIAGQVWDMIGLLDSITVIKNHENNDMSVVLEGRDLMKVLLEDGAYFYPIQFANNIFSNIQDDDKLLKRTFTSKSGSGPGEYNAFLMQSYRSIKQQLQIIFNQLSNLGIVDDNFFIDYGDRRTKVYRLDSEANNDINGGFEEKLANGIWQIIKLNIDGAENGNQKVTSRRITDPSLANPDGPLFQYIQNVCQFPLVEFFGDTYGDTYNFIVRQPPFTKTAILDFIDRRNTQGEEIMITIEDEDLISLQLVFDEEGAYSWYQMEPQSPTISGTSSSGAFLAEQLPAIYFPQFARYWGNRKYSLVNPYTPYEGYVGDKNQSSRSIFLERALDDLLYLIEINSILPFTRKGTITLNGDRRIKRGTFIRLRATNEIFYVDSVSNQFSISLVGNSLQRTTHIEVSRGMVEEYIRGSMRPVQEFGFPKNLSGRSIDEVKKAQEKYNQQFSNLSSNSLDTKTTVFTGYKPYSYFDIIRIGSLRERYLSKVNTPSIQLEDMPDYGINEPAFYFFKNKLQFK